MIYIDADQLTDGSYSIKDGKIYKDGDTAYEVRVIVKCKDCIHWTGRTEFYGHRRDIPHKKCWRLGGEYVDADFWCKYSESREGGIDHE